METEHFHFFVDQPTEWRFDEPLTNIRGWICDKNGAELTDVRAILDGTVTYGILGYDRPDIREFMGGSAAALRSGFWIQIKPWYGARELILEVLAPGNRWVEFLRTSVESKGPRLPATRPRPLLLTESVAETLHYLYRHFHYRPYKTLADECRTVIADLTAGSTEMHPENDLEGHLDVPQDWVNAHYEKFRVSGWLFSRDRQITRVVATIGISNENRMIWGKEREDVLRMNPNFPHALHSHFSGLVDVRPENHSPACLKIFVEYPDGPRQLFRSKRLLLNKIDEHSGPIPVFDELLFARTVWCLVVTTIRSGASVESWPDFWREVKLTRSRLAENLIRRHTVELRAGTSTPADPYARWVRHNALTPRAGEYLRRMAAALRNPPLISIVVPTYNTPARYLRELVDSIRAQIYPRWELCIADDASPQPHVAKLLAAAAAADARIRFTVRERNGHISAATNSALALATGDYVAFVDHDDVLPADALFHVAEALSAAPETDLVYTDEDKINEEGVRYDPHFKGAWNPEMAITHNYVHHLKVIRRSIVDASGNLRVGFEGAQDIDLILRCVELARPDRILHVPHVCYHWRAHEQSTAQKGDQKRYLFDAARTAIDEALRRRRLRASAFLPPLMDRHALCLHQLRWDPSLLAESEVTIVIPTRNRADLLSACIASLDRTIDWKNARLVIVDDGSTEPEALDLLSSLERRPGLRCRVIRAGVARPQFNYSRLVNIGTAAAETPLVLHLNNDIVALEPGWLEDMAGWLSVPGVGAVGARLVRPDGTLDHAGLSLNPDGGLPHSVFAGLPRDDFGFFFLPHAARDVLAVTGACLLTRTELYRRLGGFDEVDFQIAYNDVDYCIRAGAAGFRTVYSPQATLTHAGSASRGSQYTEREHLAFVRKYPELSDPYLSDAFRHADSTLRIDPGHHRLSRRPLRLKVAVVTHNLNLEGAPLFIFEYARYLAESADWEVGVFSPVEGPLRRKYEDAGLKVSLVDAATAIGARDAAGFQTAVDDLARRSGWSGFDLIVGNTMLAYWIVPVAQRLGKPTVLYIHESNPPRRFFIEHRLAAPEIVPLIEKAIRDCGRVVFTARATRRIFEELNANDSFRTLNSWVDIDRIRRFSESHDRASLRRKHGLDPSHTLVVNIGSICQRKGQHIFIRAVNHLNKEAGPALERLGHIEYIMVGARPGLYLETIEQDIELMGLRNVRIFPETLDIYDWYRLADIFVCTSFEESFPRVLLESAAFRIPIVSTDVNGIPEMLVNNDEAWLIPAGDYFKLAATMKSALERHFARDDRMVSMAFARVARYYDARVSLSHHVALAREAYFSAESPVR